MSAIPIFPERLDWPSAIGNFILNFGTLDHLVFGFLKDRLPSEEFTKVKEWHLKNRLERIAQHLQAAGLIAEHAAFARWVERLEPVRELRNHIAHGHLYLRHDEAGQKMTVTVFRAKDLDTGSLPNSKHVEFAELLAELTALKGLIEEFQRFFG